MNCNSVLSAVVQCVSPVVRRKMTLPDLTKQTKTHRKTRPSLYEWDTESLPLLYATCKDKHTCDYYRLLKKQMHHHISVSLNGYPIEPQLVSTTMTLSVGLKR